MVLPVWIALGIALVDRDDLLPFRDEVGAVVAEAMDDVRETEAAVLDDGCAFADVATLYEMVGHDLHAGALPVEHWHWLLVFAAELLDELEGNPVVTEN